MKQHLLTNLAMILLGVLVVTGYAQLRTTGDVAWVIPIVVVLIGGVFFMRLVAENYLDIAAATENFNRKNRYHTSVGRRVTIGFAFLGALILFLTDYHGTGMVIMLGSLVMGYVANHLPLRKYAYAQRRFPYLFGNTNHKV